MDDKPSSPKRNPFRGTSPANQKEIEKLITAGQTILKAYIKSQKVDQCIDSIYDLCTEESTYCFVIAAIDAACESFLKQINEIGTLLTTLVIEKKIISYQQFHKG